MQNWQPSCVQTLLRKTKENSTYNRCEKSGTFLTSKWVTRWKRNTMVFVHILLSPLTKWCVGRMKRPTLPSLIWSSTSLRQHDEILNTVCQKHWSNCLLTLEMPSLMPTGVRTVKHRDYWQLPYNWESVLTVIDDSQHSCILHEDVHRCFYYQERTVTKTMNGLLQSS